MYFCKQKFTNRKKIMERYRALPQLGLVEAVKLAAGRLTDFGGRSRRSEFWWWIAVIMIVKVALAFFLPAHFVVPALIIDILVMGCALSVTARRLQDAGYNAFWVYLSYALGIATSIFQVTGKMVEFLKDYRDMIERYGTNIKEAQVQPLVEEYAGTLTIYGGLMLAWGISSLVVVILCLLDSKPTPTKHGPSPKYIVENDSSNEVNTADSSLE